MIRHIVLYLAVLLPLLFLVSITSEKKHRQVLGFFMWGMTACLLAAFLLRLLSQTGTAEIEREITYAPLVEETLKASLLVLVFRRSARNGVSWIGLGMAIGVGFAVQENLVYLSAMSLDTVAALDYILVRVFSTCLMHGLTVAILGFGLEWLSRAKIASGSAVIGIYSFSVVYHALFNLLVGSNLYLVTLVMGIGIYLYGLLYILPKLKGGADGIHGENQVLPD